MKKSELRKKYLKKRNQISYNDARKLSEKISNNFFENVTLKDVKCLHCFLPIEKRNEIYTWDIIDNIWKNHPDIKIVAPVSDMKKMKMKSVQLTPKSRLKVNEWSIP
ncbi:MAG: 5-formyltetrahydrofolate cyclo-ligase, partial [Flavobacteriales bacterium]